MDKKPGTLPQGLFFVVLVVVGCGFCFLSFCLVGWFVSVIVFFFLVFSEVLLEWSFSLLKC